MAYVYRHIRLDKNEPFYIGVGLKDDNFKRAYDKTKYKRNKFWNRIVNKSSYLVDILFDNVSIEFAKEKEKEFIKLYGRRNLGEGTLCNLTDGGDGMIGWVAPKETIEKMRAAAKLRPLPLCTPEIISKRAESMRGKKRTEEQRKNISNSLKGKPQPKEAIEKMKATIRLPHNIEKRRNQPNCKKVICNENGVVYRSAAEASRQLKINRSAISMCCLGLRKQSKGLTFNFI